MVGQQLSNNAWAQVREIFGLPVDVGVAPLGGDQNRVYAITIPGGDQQVVRLSQPGTEKSRIISELMVLKHLGQNKSFRVPTPITTRHSQLCDTIIEDDEPLSTPAALFSFIAGDPLSGIIPSSQMMFSLGQTLGQLDLALQQADEVIIPRPSGDRIQRDGGKIIDNFLQELKHHQEHFRFLQGVKPAAGLPLSILKVINRLRRHYKKLLNRLPHQLLHCDAHFDNLVFNGTNLGILDFDNMRYGPRIYELAPPLHTIHEMDMLGKLSSCPDTVTSLSDALLAGYDRYIHLTKLERRGFALVQAVRLFVGLGWGASLHHQVEWKTWVEETGPATLARISALLDEYESHSTIQNFFLGIWWRK